MEKVEFRQKTPNFAVLLSFRGAVWAEQPKILRTDCRRPAARNDMEKNEKIFY